MPAYLPGCVVVGLSWLFGCERVGRGAPNNNAPVINDLSILLISKKGEGEVENERKEIGSS